MRQAFLLGCSCVVITAAAAALHLADLADTDNAAYRIRRAQDIGDPSLIRFSTIYTNRNLRGLFPLEQDESDTERAKDSSATALGMVGSGGQVAYITEVVRD